MKPLTFTRGAGLAGAITLLHAQIAFGRSSANAFEHTPLHLSSKAVTHTAAGTATGIGGSVVRTIVGLAIVIAVIYGLTWILRQAKAARNPATGFGLEQVASLPLGANKSVALVRVGSELHLIGISEHAVTSIRNFTEDEAAEFGLPVSAPAADADPDAAPRGGASMMHVLETLRRITAR